MKAVIMAGGEGRRLLPITKTIPKPLVPVNNRPAMSYALDMLEKCKIKKAAVTTKYMAEKIPEVFGDSYNGISLVYFKEDKPLGTAGSVKNAKEFLDEDFIVLSGDAVSDFDLNKAVDFHRKRNAEVTIVLTKAKNPLEYGIVLTDDEGKIKGFIEKPAWGQAFDDTINCGIYIINKEVLDEIPDDTFYDFARQLFPKMLEQGRRLYGYTAEGYWCDIGDLKALHRCNIELAGGSVIGEECEIPRNAVIKDSVIFNGARIGNGAIIEGSIICSDAVVGWGEMILPDRVCTKEGIVSFNETKDDNLTDFGLNFAKASKYGSVGVGGEEEKRKAILSGLQSGGAYAYDFGTVTKEVTAFGVGELYLDYTIYVGDEILIFDRYGLPPSRMLQRSISGGSHTDKQHEIIMIADLRKRYIASLSNSIENLKGLRVYTENEILAMALKSSGAVIDRNNGILIEENNIGGFDKWHVLAVIIKNTSPLRLALPYSAPKGLFNFLEGMDISVMKYAECPYDNSEDHIREIVAENKWLTDFAFAVMMLCDIIVKRGKSLDNLMDEIPPFYQSEFIIAGGDSDKILVMKGFGSPDGEGVWHEYEKGGVRVIPSDKEQIRILAESVSAEAAEEILSLSKKEIEKICGK